jgi:hypothetical protein
MSGMPWEVTEHTFNIKPKSKSIKQGLPYFNLEKHRAIGKELATLLTAGFIKEVYQLDWIANTVRVPKKNGKWRMCVDYMSPNKACLKNPFYLPRIGQVVDLTCAPGSIVPHIQTKSVHR